MAIKLDRSVIRAIAKFAQTKEGRAYDRWAQKNYGISGPLLQAKTVAGESGGIGTKKARARGQRSSAGAFGPAQFIPETRAG